ncbi:DUF2845 domain-containing protein [Variovorax paradoxus]|uniref:DUF2845 domain-containing protein n=1 Tax=Variovorax paradoxus TaxID=34073 RepID=UPI0009BB4819|nr:DUF2845 domain-containing protein [Variovorax paradoxus]
MHTLLRTLASTALLFAALHPGGAIAQSLSCGGFLAGVGESKFSVLNKCGEPVLKDLVCVPRPQVEVIVTPGARGGGTRQIISQQCVPMEDWTYHRGQGNFLGIVRFYNGAVESVRDGDRIP